MATILVVEDDVRIQKALHRLFATEGYEVKCAPDGNTGLEFFQAGNVDAVVLDLMLPGISGRELCKTMKHAAQDKPVIILSAVSEVADNRAFVVAVTELPKGTTMDIEVALKEAAANVKGTIDSKNSVTVVPVDRATPIRTK